MNTGLVLVDIQNDYFPGGLMELEGSVEAARQAQRLLKRFRDLRWPVIHVQHLSMKPGATFFLPDTSGAEIHESVKPLRGEPVIVKYYPNSFRETLLLHRLLEADVRRLVLVGMMTHMCVDATVRAAFDHRFECVVAGDACATRSLVYEGESIAATAVHRSFLAALHGTYAQVRGTDAILADMQAGVRSARRGG